MFIISLISCGFMIISVKCVGNPEYLPCGNAECSRANVIARELKAKCVTFNTTLGMCRSRLWLDKIYPGAIMTKQNFLHEYCILSQLQSSTTLKPVVVPKVNQSSPTRSLLFNTAPTTPLASSITPSIDTTGSPTDLRTPSLDTTHQSIDTTGSPTDLRTSSLDKTHQSIDTTKASFNTPKTVSEILEPPITTRRSIPSFVFMNKPRRRNRGRVRPRFKPRRRNGRSIGVCIILGTNPFRWNKITGADKFCCDMWRRTIPFLKVQLYGPENQYQAWPVSCPVSGKYQYKDQVMCGSSPCDKIPCKKKLVTRSFLVTNVKPDKSFGHCFIPWIPIWFMKIQVDSHCFCPVYEKHVDNV